MTSGEGPPMRSATRGMWTLLEPIHALVYFDPICRSALEAAGLRGFWRGYFAGRAAPLGMAGPALVTAVFYTFAPRMVERALPSVWELATPAQALEARVLGATAALREVTPDPDLVSALAELLWTTVSGAETGGRPLGAANAALDRPAEPYAALWQAATTIRELRGDGHVAALVSCGVSGIEALVLRSALDLDRALLLQARGWTQDEWSAAVERLAGRGWVTVAETPRITAAGRRVLAEVEERTDLAAEPVWADLTARGTLTGLAAQLLPMARRCAGRLPRVTPIGIGQPWDPVTEPAGAKALVTR